MGRISGIKTQQGEKVTVSLELNQKELKWLKGNLDKMHIFSESNLAYETKLVQRGKRESSKYFLMPKDLRKNLIVNSRVMCNRLETSSKQIFIFSMDKLGKQNHLPSDLELSNFGK